MLPSTEHELAIFQDAHSLFLSALFINKWAQIPPLPSLFTVSQLSCRPPGHFAGWSLWHLKMKQRISWGHYLIFNMMQQKESLVLVLRDGCVEDNVIKWSSDWDSKWPHVFHDHIRYATLLFILPIMLFDCDLSLYSSAEVEKNDFKLAVLTILWLFSFRFYTTVISQYHRLWCFMYFMKLKITKKNESIKINPHFVYLL